MSNWNFWSILVFIIAILIISPVLAIFYSAFSGNTELWPHLFSTVLPKYTINTFILMFGVGSLSLFFGVSTAWIITRYDFPIKTFLEWALLLPAAIPAYIIAYTYTDILEYAGPIQGLLRDFFGWKNAKDYWFPNIRSMGGAIFVMSSVLYPYIFLMARASFISTPLSYYHTSMLHGKKLNSIIKKTLQDLEVKNGELNITDNGGQYFVLQARIETVIKSANPILKKSSLDNLKKHGNFYIYEFKKKQ